MMKYQTKKGTKKKEKEVDLHVSPAGVCEPLLSLKIAALAHFVKGLRTIKLIPHQQEVLTIRLCLKLTYLSSYYYNLLLTVFLPAKHAQNKADSGNLHLKSYILTALVYGCRWPAMAIRCRLISAAG